MAKRYEYDFVHMGDGWLGVKHEALTGYQEVVRQRAQQGWRLVQVFAPSVPGHGGLAGYIELIFEREIA